MAYNPFYFQSSYPANNYPYGYYSPQQAQGQANNGVTWVQGIEGAKAYPVGAGNSVLLMDSDNQYMYIKSADNTGMPSLKIYEYHELVDDKTESHTQANMEEYVTKKEFEEAIAKLKSKKKKIIEVEEDE